MCVERFRGRCGVGDQCWPTVNNAASQYGNGAVRGAIGEGRGMAETQQAPETSGKPSAWSRRTTWLVVGVMSVAVAAVTGVAAYVNHSHGTGTPHVWVGGDDTGVALVELTRDGAALSGTIDTTEIPDDKPTTTASDHRAFTGTLDGSSVTLRVDGVLGMVTAVSGTLANGELNLDLADGSTGTVQTLRLTPSSVADYNRAASKLKAKANEALQQVQQEQAAQAKAQADQELRQKIDTAAHAVDEAAGTLQQALATGPDYSPFQSAIASAQQDLSTAETDARRAKALGHDETGDGCSAAGDAESAAGDVESDEGDAESAQGDVDSAVSDISSDVSALQEAWAAYQDVQSQTSDYVPIVSSADAVKQLESKAAGVIKEMQRKAGGYVATAKALVDQADKVAQGADSAAC